MNAEQIGRFVRALLREWFSGNDSHYYDAVHIALVESATPPLATVTCEHVHSDTLIERVNHFADQLRAGLENDDQFQRAVCAVVTTVLNERTTIAPQAHPASGVLRELIQCCAPGPTSHIDEYDDYAALIAHVGSCKTCARRVGTMAV